MKLNNGMEIDEYCLIEAIEQNRIATGGVAEILDEDGKKIIVRVKKIQKEAISYD
jgi:hypothetical protein